MKIIPIWQLDLPELRCYTHLTEGELCRADTILVESTRAIEQALEAGLQPLSLLVPERFAAGKAASLLSRCGEAPVYTAPEALLQQLTGYALTRGVLAAFRRPAAQRPEAVCAGAKRVAVLDGITDAANVGAIFRSAAALGMDALLLSADCCDPLTRRALRVSMGASLRLPWARLEHAGAAAAAEVTALGFTTAAMALDSRALPPDAPSLHSADRLALFLGTEGTGLTPETVAACARTVCIPMTDRAESLNVAAAAAIAFWELGRKC